MENMADEESVHAQAIELLLFHLRHIDAHFWPGTDGLTVDSALNGYAEAAAAGQVPGLDDLVKEHLELMNELETIVAGAADRAIPDWHWPPGLSRELRRARVQLVISGGMLKTGQWKGGH